MRGGVLILNIVVCQRTHQGRGGGQRGKKRCFLRALDCEGISLAVPPRRRVTRLTLALWNVDILPFHRDAVNISGGGNAINPGPTFFLVTARRRRRRLLTLNDDDCNLPLECWAALKLCGRLYVSGGGGMHIPAMRNVLIPPLVIRDIKPNLSRFKVNFLLSREEKRRNMN